MITSLQHLSQWFSHDNSRIQPQDSGSLGIDMVDKAMVVAGEYSD